MRQARWFVLLLAMALVGCSGQAQQSTVTSRQTPPGSEYAVRTKPGIGFVVYEYRYPPNPTARTGETIQLWTKDGRKLGGADGMGAAMAPDGVYYRTQVDPETTGEIRFLGSDGTSRVVGPNPKGGQWVMTASPSGRKLFLRPGWVIDTRTGDARPLVADARVTVAQADWVDDDTVIAPLTGRGLSLIKDDAVTLVEGTAGGVAPSANGRRVYYWVPTHPLDSLAAPLPADGEKVRSRTLAILDLDRPEASRVMTGYISERVESVDWFDDDTLVVSRRTATGPVVKEYVEFRPSPALEE